MSYESKVDAAALEVFQRVTKGEKLTLALCRRVIEEQGRTARPGPVL